MAVAYTYTVPDADIRRAAHRLRSGQVTEAFWDERKHLRWPKGVPTGGEFKAIMGIGGPKLPVKDTKLKQESPLQRIIALLGHKTGLWASHYDRQCARGGSDPKLDLKKWKRQHPEVADEPYFVYTSRVVQGLDARKKHEMIFQLRETPEPVPFIAEGMRHWRSNRGLPEPDIAINSVRAPLDKAVAVGKAFALTPDQAHDPRVQAAFADFARQNDEMWSFATRSEAEGGLGIKVTFSLSPDEPYQSAAEQADDLRINRHITTQSGLGGKHTLLTRYQYDRFRAVHDIFGHAAIGGGFDRHGEYQAWLAHMSMYVPPGASAMASEYHGVNSNMWVQAAETVGTGRACSCRRRSPATRGTATGPSSSPPRASSARSPS